MDILPYIATLIIAIIGTILARYIMHRFDESLKERKNKKLEEDVKAKEKFEMSIKYYLSLPNSRTEAKIDLVERRLALVTNILFGFLLSIISVMFIFLAIMLSPITSEILLIVGIIGYLIFCFIWWGFQAYNQISYQKQVFSEIDKRLRKEGSQEPTKPSQ